MKKRFTTLVCILLVLTACGSITGINDSYTGQVTEKNHDYRGYRVVIGTRNFAVTKEQYDAVQFGDIYDCGAYTYFNGCKKVSQ